VKIKVGPITATYKGVARFVERDEAGLRAVLRAEGRDARQGNANATITATLVPAGTGTQVTVDTDLTISGKVAQFGRGVLADVSSKLIDQFVACLDADLLAGPSGTEPADPVLTNGATSEPAAAPAAAAAPRQISGPAPAPVNLVGTVGMPVAKRLAPLALGLALVVYVILRMRRR
jgi:hypothetical protein